MVERSWVQTLLLGLLNSCLVKMPKKKFGLYPGLSFFLKEKEIGFEIEAIGRVSHEELNTFIRVQLKLKFQDIASIQILHDDPYCFVGFKDEEKKHETWNLVKNGIIWQGKGEVYPFLCTETYTEVKVKNVQPGTDALEVGTYMSTWGEIISSKEYMNKFGLNGEYVPTGDFLVRMKVNEVIPMHHPRPEEGMRWVCIYEGQENVCWRCWEPGHMTRECREFNVERSFMRQQAKYGKLKSTRDQNKASDIQGDMNLEDTNTGDRREESIVSGPRLIQEASLSISNGSGTPLPLGQGVRSGQSGSERAESETPAQNRLEKSKGDKNGSDSSFGDDVTDLPSGLTIPHQDIMPSNSSITPLQPGEGASGGSGYLLPLVLGEEVGVCTGSDTEPGRYDLNKSVEEEKNDQDIFRSTNSTQSQEPAIEDELEDMDMTEEQMSMSAARLPETDSDNEISPTQFPAVNSQLLIKALDTAEAGGSRGARGTLRPRSSSQTEKVMTPKRNKQLGTMELNNVELGNKRDTERGSTGTLNLPQIPRPFISPTARLNLTPGTWKANKK